MPETPENGAAALVYAIRQLVAKAGEYDVPRQLVGRILVDQGTKILVEAEGREEAAKWLDATLDDVKAKGFETTSGQVGRA